MLTSDAGDSSQAASFYAQLIREYPRSPLLAWAWFNRGKIELRAGEFEEARKSFFQVIDGSPGHELAAASRLYVGRLFLELGQPEHAVRPLIRATTQAAGEDVQTEAALLLASAYLTTGKPYPASMVLMDYRKPLMREETVDRAAFLSALARFQATTDPAQMNEEGRNLVTAITRIHVGDFFGASMIPLAGAAYRQLQLHGQMAELYRQALPRISSPPIRDQLHRELGEWYRQSGRLSEAADHFRALTDSTTRQTQLHGRRELASIAFDLKLDQDCLRSCRRLLTETGDDAEKLAVLDLMGRVYERRGEYSNAAMCFAGLLPDGTLVDGKKPTERAADSREILRD